MARADSRSGGHAGGDDLPDDSGVRRVFDPKTGKELAHLPTKRKIVHGAVVTPDDKYAFISVEGIGSEPGTVEVIDLAAMKTVATIDVGSQAAGIDFWKNEAPKP